MLGTPVILLVAQVSQKYMILGHAFPRVRSSLAYETYVLQSKLLKRGYIADYIGEYYPAY